MPDAAAAPQVVRLADYRPPAWLVPAIELSFDLNEARTRVTAKLTVERNGKHGGPLVLDGEDLSLVSLQLDGVELTERNYVRQGDRLTLPIRADSAVLETVVEIAPATNTQLMGLY